jgi:hypothetical protein
MVCQEKNRIQAKSKLNGRLNEQKTLSKNNIGRDPVDS